MISARMVALFFLVAATAGCQEEEDKPPQYSPVAVPGGLVPCEALHDGTAQIDGSGAVRYDGGLAACFPNGIVCTAGPCDGGLGVARCLAGRWLWGCEPVEGGAGVPEAGHQDAPEPQDDGG